MTEDELIQAVHRIELEVEDIFSILAENNKLGDDGVAEAAVDLENAAAIVRLRIEKRSRVT